MIETGKLFRFPRNNNKKHKKGRSFVRKTLTCEEFIQKQKEEADGTPLPVQSPKTRRNDPVNKLARTLRRYKEKRIKSEEALVKIMEKVKLDKTILIKEKMNSIWSKDDYNNSKEVQYEIEKCKQKRHDVNIRQK